MKATKIPKRTITIIEGKRSNIVEKEKYEQQRVGAYCRVSTDSEEQLTSYKNQMKVYTDMITQKKEWCFAGLYADEGISGTIANKRPEFKRMIKDCLDGKIDYIITKSVSRFARNTVDCLEYVRMLKARGIGIYFEEQNIDTLKSDSELYLIIYAGFAQSESESISKNITWSVRKNFEDGKVIFIYKKMLGYKKGEDGTPQIIPEEAVIIEEIFNMYLAGNTIKGISDEMKRRDLKFPEKNISFGPQMVQNILSNEKYCGDAILQKTVTIDCISKTRKLNTGEAPMYYVHNNHPAIIDRELFNKVQEELARRKAIAPQSTKTSLTASGKYSQYALGEVLKCAECGTRYRRVTWSKRGKKKVVWRCVNRLDFGTVYCKSSPTLEEESLHQKIVSALKQFNQEDAQTYIMLMKATIGDAIGLGGGSEEIDMLERRIEALNKNIINLVNNSINNGSDVESHEEEFKSMSQEIEQLKSRIRAIQESEQGNEDLQERLALIQSTISDRLQNQDRYDDSIVRQMIECIKVHEEGKLEIIFGGGYTVIV